ncbi:hypothetical protein PILCRDRAFT_8526 [Piloderma croceum F 1598]|uniref:Uncharacterized protein n=1 Tax=Piloderma croceum (strain F 1598) TaxID=765440 RepID=A0A0C3B6L1_PILCF|nr:hypothetical protein PILCRDRAFT_821236 [Piloderma croceum F 1598]KIM81878.1 hypothetical protein PILCRDRAFT_8526 [Piloderma croceum F 1598]
MRKYEYLALEQPSLIGKHNVPETRFVASSGNALSARYCSKSVKHMIGNSGGHKIFCKGLAVRRLEGRIADIFKRDFEFMGAIIEAERLRMKDAIPEMFRTVNTKLLVLSLDFRVCPPTTLLPPENFDICEYYDNGALRERWEH